MRIRCHIAFMRAVPLLVSAALTLAACTDDPTSPALRPSALRASLADSAAADSAAADSVAPRTETIVVAPDTARLVVGRTRTLAAVVRDTAGAPIEDRVVAWSSSDTTVATVDSVGVVTGIA